VNGDAGTVMGVGGDGLLVSLDGEQIALPEA
jgi:hypothetical protein